ncbi:MAG: hypothetical protein MZW92_77595 [Comamonadaceae bacterium]|nr:hypothetical protein [Comamonadaceae bacterium]
MTQHDAAPAHARRPAPRSAVLPHPQPPGRFPGDAQQAGQRGRRRRRRSQVSPGLHDRDLPAAGRRWRTWPEPRSSHITHPPRRPA